MGKILARDVSLKSNLWRNLFVCLPLIYTCILLSFLYLRVVYWSVFSSINWNFNIDKDTGHKLSRVRSLNLLLLKKNYFRSLLNNYAYMYNTCVPFIYPSDSSNLLTKRYLLKSKEYLLPLRVFILPHQEKYLFLEPCLQTCIKIFLFSIRIQLIVCRSFSAQSFFNFFFCRRRWWKAKFKSKSIYWWRNRQYSRHGSKRGRSEWRWVSNVMHNVLPNPTFLL